MTKYLLYKLAVFIKFVPYDGADDTMVSYLRWRLGIDPGDDRWRSQRPAQTLNNHDK